MLDWLSVSVLQWQICGFVSEACFHFWSIKSQFFWKFLSPTFVLCFLRYFLVLDSLIRRLSVMLSSSAQFYLVFLGCISV